ncbi:hypothetical protein TNCV_142321 [Trichonephila clavipes]|nr:hypothetical protein TNCV_142321 [Trichonephila clavipes]
MEVSGSAFTPPLLLGRQDGEEATSGTLFYTNHRTQAMPRKHPKDHNITSNSTKSSGDVNRVCTSILFSRYSHPAIYMMKLKT